MEFPLLDSNFRKGVINRALKVERKLLEAKVIERLETVNIEDFPEQEEQYTL